MVLVTVLAAAGCTGDDDASAPVTATTSASMTTAPTAGLAGLRSVIPIGDDPCDGDPPFRFSYLPEGFSPAIATGPNRPTGDTVEPFGGEPYDATHHLPGPGVTAIAVFHGTSWRLDARATRHVAVLGGEGVVGRLPDGSTLIEFPTAGRSSGCDWWAVAGVGVPDAEVLRVAAGLRRRS
jgi:hypothetical protein